MRFLLVISIGLFQGMPPAYASADRKFPSARPVVVFDYQLPNAYFRSPLDIDLMPRQPQKYGMFRLFPGTSGGSSSVGIVGVGMSEGPLLETMVWGGGGAVVGSLVGPLGTVIGATVGAAAGFLVGLVYAPAKAAAVPCAQPLPGNDGLTSKTAPRC